MKLFLFAINDETNSLRHLDNQLVNPKLRKAIGVDEISYSQLSRALKALDSSVLMEIFSQLLLLVHQQTEGQKNEKIYLVDSTTFSFSQPSYPWAKFRKTKSGVKLHLSVCFMEDGLLHPEQFEISNAVEHDSDHLEVLVNKLTPKAKEIGKMYKSRWQIELFFKHIKQHMTIKKYFSKSEDGVVNQIILAMIVYLLTLLIKLELGLKQTIFQILRVFRSIQFENYDYFIRIFDPG